MAYTKFNRTVSTATGGAINPAASKQHMFNGLFTEIKKLRNTKFCCTCKLEKSTTGGKFFQIHRAPVEKFRCADCVAYRAFDPVI